MGAWSGKVVLCERGIRTFEKYTRNTTDINAVPVIKQMSHLPVVVDPSRLFVTGGSGALGLEAASRGAAVVVLVEAEPRVELREASRVERPRRHRARHREKNLHYRKRH